MTTSKASLCAATKQLQASRGAILILLLAVLYNAFLAFINSHGFRLNPGHVMISEAAILFLACCYILIKSTNLSEHWRSFVFVYIIFVLFFWSILMNQNVYIKAVRDMIIMPVFVLLGCLAVEKDLIRMMRYLTAVLAAFMVLEGWFTNIYVSIFQPALYYANTRGVQELSTDSSGLFRNSLGFSGRFTFGIFDTHRLSSLLLEQVSLANFSMVLGLFLITFWDKLRRPDRIFFAGSVLFIILSNNTRTGTLVNLIFIVGYFVFPVLPKRLHLLYIPMLMLISFAIFYNPHFHSSMATDDVSGRVGLTVNKLSELDLSTFFVGKLNSVTGVLDSGYLYLLYSQTGFGLIAYWIYTSLIVPSDDPNTKRFANGLSIYIALNLLIGAGIFTIKTAGPLWFIAGYLIKQASNKTIIGSPNVKNDPHSVRA